MRKEPQKAHKAHGLLALFVFSSLLMGAQVKPHIDISPARAKSGDSVYLSANGCSPGGTVLSHLLRPNGTEYNPLRLRTDERGELTHKIDTTMLSAGTYEAWIEDEPSKAVSNRAKFTVE
jgi:hypothetical protein